MISGVVLTAPPPPPPVPSTLPPLSFGAAFGDNMVLQMEPAKAAVYGYLGPGGRSVTVTVKSNDGATQSQYTVEAKLNSTVQPFGKEYAVRPANTYNPWNEPLATWKALLPPTTAGGDYTITATCTGCTSGPSSVSISNVAFGDMWYCSGQSNMWLPVSHTYSRNETVAAIKGGKYNNVRLMAGNSGTDPSFPASTKADKGKWDPTKYGGANGSNPWMTAMQAIATGASSGTAGGNYPLFSIGAACWYFAQQLSELGVKHPIGIADTAIGGQRIEEYMTNTSISNCTFRSGSNGATGVETEASREFDAILYAKQVIPFVDMTVKGWTWYQGENNMGAVKGNSAANVGYGCLQRALVKGWRAAWSSTEPGTTDPNAPFGIVTLASSGSEGGPHMGAMRQAQTASYGVLPGPQGSGMENTFFAQAYDLDDEWGGPGWAHLACHHNNEGKPCSAPPYHQPCLTLQCCPVGGHQPGVNTTTCNATFAKLCTNACNAAASTPQYMGGIHPRSKKQVGDRLGTAAFNTVYGGKGSFTGPTLSSCSITSDEGGSGGDSGGDGGGGGGSSLIIQFNTALLAGDTLMLNPPTPVSKVPSWWINATEHSAHLALTGGTLLYVQTNASNYCMEPMLLPSSYNASSGAAVSDMSYCPTWAGGEGLSGLKQNTTRTVDTTGWVGFDSSWTMLNFEKDSDSSIKVDLSPLKGLVPTAVRYAWGSVDCCDTTDPMLYVTHGCVASCPIMSTGALPANPFMAKIVGGKCECVAPQVC